MNLTAKRLLAHINFAPEVQAPNERVVMKIIYLQGQAAVTPPPGLPLLACPSYCTCAHTHARTLLLLMLYMGKQTELGKTCSSLLLGNLFSDFFFHLDKQSLSFLIHTRARAHTVHAASAQTSTESARVLLYGFNLSRRKNSRFGPCHVLRQLRATDRQKKVQTVAWATAAPRDGFLSSLHTACKQEDQRQTYRR